MKSNGFTLIELLAVIVILAIIALIAVPIVINIISDTKEESMKKSVSLYLDTVEKTLTQENLKVKYYPDTCVIQDNKNLICSENGVELITSNGSKELEINIKGEKPTNGTILLYKGKIISVENLLLRGSYYRMDEDSNIVQIHPPKKILSPGLYDENNNLVATWHDLVNTYDLKIINGELNSNIKEVLRNNKLENGKVLVISNDVTKIGEYAFQRCSSITDIIIPNSVIEIERNAFALCKNLKNINLPENINVIEDSVFEGCNNLTNITLPLGITSIGNRAFFDCNSLTNIIIPNSVTSIDAAAFAYSGLKNINLPNSVISIGEYAFRGCQNLVSVNLPNNITNIKQYTFSDCDSLTSITIPNSVISIRNAAFYSCSTLKKVIFEENSSLKIIMSLAFSDCNQLASITLPNSVVAVFNTAFLDCEDLQTINVDASSTWGVIQLTNFDPLDYNLMQIIDNASPSVVVQIIEQYNKNIDIDNDLPILIVNTNLLANLDLSTINL